MAITVNEKCQPCSGAGVVSPNKKKCEPCKGTGKVERDLSYLDLKSLVIDSILEARCR